MLLIPNKAIFAISLGHSAYVCSQQRGPGASNEIHHRWPIVLGARLEQDAVSNLAQTSLDNVSDSHSADRECLHGLVARPIFADFVWQALFGGGKNGVSRLWRITLPPALNRPKYVPDGR